MEEVKKNDEYVVDITGMTHEGLGVGRIGELAVFVKDALPGETVRVKVILLKKTYAVGKMMEIIKKSDERTEPVCPVYKRCGGCSLQHMSYTAQLEFKTNQVKDAIKRIAGLENVKVLDTIGMKEPYNYRNKVQYPVGIQDNKPVIGFYARRSHDIVVSDICVIQDSISDKVKKVISDFLNHSEQDKFPLHRPGIPYVSVYDEKTGKGLIRHILVKKAFATGEVMVVVVINGYELPGSNTLVEMLLDNIPGLKSVMLNVNTQKTNTVLGNKNITLFGQDYIVDYIGKYKFRISPHSFYQVNPVQTKVLYDKVLEYAGLSGKETVFDIYSGIGTISLFLSEAAKEVHGIEVVEDAVEDARQNAVLNGIGNVHFHLGGAEEVVPELYKQGLTADVVVVDPPRKGCDEKVLETCAEMKPERLIYVSCNPATLARDLKYLAEKGFSVQQVQPVDMFPQTCHVECVVSLKRKHSS